MVTFPVAPPYGSTQESLYAADVASTELMGVEDARKKLGDRVKRAADDELHTVVTVHGQPAAVLVDIAWYTKARESLGDPTDIRVAPRKVAE
jgi:prevent-host-death family protein